MANLIQRDVPPLNNGDKLTRAEFLRRWELHPEINNAELIGGVVYVSSRVTLEHGDMQGAAGVWLGTYRIATPGTASGHRITSFILEDTLQPDVHLRILPEYGGRSRSDGEYLAGIPELLLEIRPSSAAYDLDVKL